MVVPDSDIQALIFDCDGTLTNSMPLHYRAWRAILDPLDIAFTERKFYELAGVPSTQVWARVSDERHTEIDVQELLLTREKTFFELINDVQGIEPVLKIARRHRGRYPMGVASGSVRESVRRQLSQLRILDWFDCVVAAEDTERHKPEPDVFLEAARQMGVDPRHCRVYEDSALGIEAARRAGMQWVDVRPMYQ